MFYSHLKSMSLLLVVSLGFMKGGGLTFTALRRDRADGFIETYYGSYSAESFNLRSGPSRGGGGCNRPPLFILLSRSSVQPSGARWINKGNVMG